MKDKPVITVFIFRRDLRVKDNVALHMLADAYSGIPILPVFLFDKQQVTAKNRLYNPNIIRFMIECLHELNEKELSGKLVAFHGAGDVEILEHILTYVDVKCIAWNDDFTPFARKRDRTLQDFCKRHTIPVIQSVKEYTLFGFDEVTTQGKPYRVYTPFYRKCMTLTPSKLRLEKTSLQISFFVPSKEFGKSKYITTLDEYLPNRVSNKQKQVHIAIKGGRQQGLAILERIKKGEFKHYDMYRDFPYPNRTTRMAPYLKFGCISIREAYWACRTAYGASHGLVRELMWREFYAHISHHFPEILRRQVSMEPNLEFNKKYNTLQWNVDKSVFDTWCLGMTGFPFIDAAMRCLNETGYMHNRLRMLVASFLTKDLRIDWRMGEEYFAKTLLDYDPASNSGGWQWAAGVGADAQPYFRVFSPWVQSAKYDKDTAFIKQWVPELTDVPARHIHAWHLKHVLYKDIKYPVPCVDHTEEVKTTIKWFTSSGAK